MWVDLTQNDGLAAILDFCYNTAYEPYAIQCKQRRHLGNINKNKISKFLIIFWPDAGMFFTEDLLI